MRPLKTLGSYALVACVAGLAPSLFAGCGADTEPGQSPIHQLPGLPGTPVSGKPVNPVQPTPSAAPSVPVAMASPAATPAPRPPSAAAAPPRGAVAPSPATASAVAAMLKRTLLPGTVRPRGVAKLPRYHIDVAVDWSLFTYAGKQRVEYTNRTAGALSELYLFTYPNIADLKRNKAAGLTMDHFTVDGAPVRRVHTDGPVTRVDLAKPLAAGATLTLALDFKGVIYRLPEQTDDLATKSAIEQLLKAIVGDGSGGGGGGYGVFSVTSDIVSLGLWYPIMSAHDGKRWDLARRPSVAQKQQIGDVSYFEAGHYDVTMRLPADVTVAATGIEVERRLDGADQILRYEAGASREFTIQASRNYGKASTTVDGVAINSLYLHGHSEVGRKVLEHAGAALTYFNTTFGKYPYRELDLAEAPLIGGAGGVEFPGIVTIAKMFYGPGGRVGANNQLLGGIMSHDLMRETLEFVVAHEVAHEWFNAVVGSDSRRHPFLDEALANHAALLYFEHRHGKKAAERQRTMQAKLGYQLGRLMGGKDFPVDSPTDAFANMFEYAGVVYGKGALFFDAMRAQARDDAAHLAALAGYYKRFAFEVAQPIDLVKALTGAARDRAAAAATAQRWLYERHGDEDIGSFDLASVAGLVLPSLTSDPQIRQLLKGTGIEQIAELFQALFNIDGSLKDDFDIAQVLKTLGTFMADGDPTMERIMGLVGKVIADPDLLLDASRATELLTGLAKELVGDDPELRKLIDAAGGLLKRMAQDDAGAGGKAGNRKKRGP